MSHHQHALQRRSSTESMSLSPEESLRSEQSDPQANHQSGSTNDQTPAHLLPESSTDFCHHQAGIESLRSSLANALRGKGEVVEKVLACLLARGHLLLEDLPGLGKTTLAKAIAQAVGGAFARVQCTPDLLPSDITGFNVFNQQTREFEFLPGPVFADVLLADEINRATPRTQSALFEAMSERQVTIDNNTRQLPATFFVIATQNPVESHGAYPLPEAQRDRFAMQLSIGYPDRGSEMQMLADAVGPLGEHLAGAPCSQPADQTPGRARRQTEIERLKLTPQRMFALQDHIAGVSVSAAVQQYLVDLAQATRKHPAVTLGVSPRGLLIWQRVAQGWAHLQGRDFVLPDDVQQVAEPVLAVRLAGEFSDAIAIIEAILEAVPVPVPLP